MKIEISREQGISFVSIQGSIKLNESGRDFYTFMNNVFKEEDVSGVLVDLSKIDYIDSTGIGELVGYLHRLNKKGKHLALINPQKTIKSLITLSNLDKVFPIFSTKAEAVIYVNNPFLHST
jgi:anti-sigma B factor antagonist